MAKAYVYADTNYGGTFAELPPGSWYGQGFVGKESQGSSYNEVPLDGRISSIRIAPNAVVAIYDSTSPSMWGRGARVLIPPVGGGWLNIPDLTAFGFDDATSRIEVYGIRRYDSGVSTPGTVDLFSQTAFAGMPRSVDPGDHALVMLQSPQVGLLNSAMNPGFVQLRSLRVRGPYLVVLYSADNFDATQNALLVVGPSEVPDLATYDFIDNTRSVRVFALDVTDTPTRPTDISSRWRRAIARDPRTRNLPPLDTSPPPPVYTIQGSETGAQAPPSTEPKKSERLMDMPLWAIALVFIVLVVASLGMSLAAVLNATKSGGSSFLEGEPV